MAKQENPASSWEGASAHALDVLSVVSSWRLTSLGWRYAEYLIDRVRHAVDSEDAASLRASVDDLAAVGPTRISTALGDMPQLPAPPTVRERVNELIHDLEPDSTSNQGGDDKASR